MPFSPSETDTLIALMDRIIPADDFPSASEAGVLNYIERLFETDMRPSADSYRSGLVSLNGEGENRFNARFSALTPQQQDEIITAALSGSDTVVWDMPPSKFIRTTINIVSEGYYADPGNGGNKDAVSWNMIGFEIKEGVRLPAASI